MANNHNRINRVAVNEDEIENREWIDSLASGLDQSGPERVNSARGLGIRPLSDTNSPYVNTIPISYQPPYPGARDIEPQIRNINRWNAMVMVVKANLADPTVRRYIARYALAATLYEVAVNHFFVGGMMGWREIRYFFKLIHHLEFMHGHFLKG